MKPEDKKTREDKLEALRDHNTAIYKGDKVGTLKKKQVMEAYEIGQDNFATEVIQTREGKVKDRFGRIVPAYDISFGEALGDFYGIIAPDKIKNRFLSNGEKEMWTINQFLRQQEVGMSTDTLETMAARFGSANLSVSGVESLLVGHSKLDGLNNTNQIDGDFRFIIPELILAAIRIDYEAALLSSNWIANTVNISQREVKMPQIRRGNATPSKLREGESIPFGSVRFGQKRADVFKVGIGFKMTDELIEDSTLDMVFQFLGEVGVDMSIGADVEAHRILINGEQLDLSESAPVVGVGSVNDLVFRDLRLVIGRMKRLKRNVSRIVTSENDGVDLSLLDEFKGFNGGTKLANFNSILGVPDTLINDVWAQPANQVMLLDPGSAMVKLKYKSMKTEKRRNPQNQEEELFVSDHVGFAIKRRDGRIIIDKSLDFATNGFPDYMDIDARIQESFKYKNE